MVPKHSDCHGTIIKNTTNEGQCEFLCFGGLTGAARMTDTRGQADSQLGRGSVQSAYRTVGGRRAAPFISNTFSFTSCSNAIIIFHHPHAHCPGAYFTAGFQRSDASQPSYREKNRHVYLHLSRSPSARISPGVCVCVFMCLISAQRSGHTSRFTSAPGSIRQQCYSNLITIQLPTPNS